MLHLDLAAEEKESRIPKIVKNLRKNFNNRITKSYEYRSQQLRALHQLLVDNEEKIKQALHDDLGKPPLEALTTEILLVRHEIENTLEKLNKWMTPRKVSVLFAAQPGWGFVQPEPLGVVLIISPWNYPFQLSFMPLIGAIAAGNCAILKPSELAPASSKLMAELLPKYLDSASYQVIEGAIPETTELLEQKFDHIFFTGSNAVGKIVMMAAAKNLTPVTLELGGKSPCIVDESANIEVTARRILWGKFSNSGQTCIAPDYLLVHEAVEEKLVNAMVKILHEFYGENPQESKDYGRIINHHHYQRLMKLIPKEGEVIVGGIGDEKSRYIAPTLLKNIPEDAPIMKKENEIFGPLLPIHRVKDMEEAIKFVNERPKPLALYLFSENSDVRKNVIENTSSGGVVIDHTLLSGCVLTLPFGGVGDSGLGAYHGKDSFKTFSHYKSVFMKPAWKWDIPSYVSEPPATPFKEKLVRMVL